MTMHQMIGERLRVFYSDEKGTTYRASIPEAAMGAPRQNRSDRWKQRDCVLRYRAWCDLLRLHCPNPPAPETVEVITVTAFFPMPPSWPQRKREKMKGRRMRQKPDGDNVLKGICDALWKQDQALGGQAVHRFWWTEGRTEILIETAPASPAAKE